LYQFIATLFVSFKAFDLKSYFISKEYSYSCSLLASVFVDIFYFQWFTFSLYVALPAV
jgi:hypothetical protein